MRRLVILFGVLMVACSGLTQPAQIILIRHAEKPADPEAPDLSPEGRHRARELVPYITREPALTGYGLPVAIYATQRTKHGHSVRTQETVAPLARELHLPILTPYPAENYKKLAHSILTNPKYQGKTVLICWVHEYIPQLAAALGVSPELPKWKGDVYDRVYLISYSGGNVKLQQLRQPGPP